MNLTDTISYCIIFQAEKGVRKEEKKEKDKEKRELRQSSSPEDNREKLVM